MADLLGRAARARRDVSYGSYPFGHGSVGEIGTNLVLRGRDEAALDAATDALLAELSAQRVSARLAPSPG